MKDYPISLSHSQTLDLVSIHIVLVKKEMLVIYFLIYFYQLKLLKIIKL